MARNRNSRDGKKGQKGQKHDETKKVNENAKVSCAIFGLVAVVLITWWIVRRENGHGCSELFDKAQNSTSIGSRIETIHLIGVHCSGEDEAIPVLTEILNNTKEDPFVRSSAVIQLVRLNAKSVVPAMKKCMAELPEHEELRNRGQTVLHEKCNWAIGQLKK